MKGRYGSSIVVRHVPRRTVCVSCAIAARTVSWWTPSAAAMVPTFQCSPKYSRRISACCSGVIMACLRGHATDSPGRWKEPRAFAAADHTAQRARQGRGRRSIRRRVRGQCARRRRRAGSLIPHAGAIRALVIPMIEAAFRTAPMAPARRADRGMAGGRATGRRAIRVAPITRRADREEAITVPAGFLAKRRVHDVGAAARSDWTRRSNRGTRETTGSVRRSIEAVTEGLEGSAPGPHLRWSRTSAYATRARSPSSKRLWTLPQPWTHRTRPPLLGNLAEEREIPTAPTAILFFSEEQRRRTTRTKMVPVYAVSWQRAHPR